MNPVTPRRTALAIAALGVITLAITAALTPFRTSRTVIDRPGHLTGQFQTGAENTQIQPAQPGPANPDSGALLATVAGPRPEPTPFTRHLVAALTNLDFTQG